MKSLTIRDMFHNYISAHVFFENIFKYVCKICEVCNEENTPCRARTCDIRIRNPMLYPTEPTGQDIELYIIVFALLSQNNH